MHVLENSGCIYTVEPPNKGHFGSRAFVSFNLLGGCPLVGGSNHYCKQ